MKVSVLLRYMFITTVLAILATSCAPEAITVDGVAFYAENVVFYKGGDCLGGTKLTPEQRALACKEKKVEDEKARDEKEQEALRQAEANARAEREAEAREKASRAARNAEIENERERGYTAVSFETVLLDGRDMARNELKVSIDGYDLKVGDLEYIISNARDAMAAVSMVIPITAVDEKIGILTDDAPRNTRAYLLYSCRKISNGPFAGGCPLRILGHMTMCQRTTLVSITQVPCIVVEDSWQ
jgi:hypothetical protein